MTAHCSTCNCRDEPPPPPATSSEWARRQARDAYARKAFRVVVDRMIRQAQAEALESAAESQDVPPASFTCTALWRQHLRDRASALRETTDHVAVTGPERPADGLGGAEGTRSRSDGSGTAERR